MLRRPPTSHQFLLQLLAEQVMICGGGGPGGGRYPPPPPPPPPTAKSARQPLSTQRPRPSIPQVLFLTQGEPLIWRMSWASRAPPMLHQFLFPLLDEQLMVWAGGPPRPMTNSARPPLSTQRPRPSLPP